LELRHPMRFSVVIPTLDSPGLAATLSSLQAQTYSREDIEVLVVGRTMGAVTQFPWAHFLASSDALAPAQARNIGAQAATGEVLAFIDSDCVAAPDWLFVLSLRFADPSVGVVGGGVEIRAGSYWNLADNLSLFHDYLASLPSGTRRQLPSLNLGTRRDLFLEAGGFDERYPLHSSAEDSDLTIRLRDRGYRLYFEPRAVVWHASPRTGLKALLQRAHNQGQYSTKVDRRYVGTRDALPWPLRSPATLLVGAPLIAAIMTMLIYTRDPAIWKWWYASPGVFLGKFAGCLGAARPQFREARTGGPVRGDGHFR
jgi:GT2 family glycosyltransferase